MAWMVALAAAAGTNLFEMTPSQFAGRTEAKQIIRLEAVDTNLMSAAVLHETNRKRAENKLRPLRHHPKALQAAAIQSQIMQKRGSISHENPENAKYQTLIKRVQAVGVNPGLAAENVATAFGVRYESGKAFYKREERGKPIFSYTPDGPPLPPHTYESFAKALVDAWMDSPGHRKNILLADAEYLGVSCVGGKKNSDMPIFYCTQVFLAPLRPARR
jgi:uncharacterized protein YkwD